MYSTHDSTPLYNSWGSVPSTQISESELANALVENRFELSFQPKVSLLTGDVIGAEALVRLRRENGTLVLPDEFLPLAESSGVLGQLALKMLDKAVLAIGRIKQRHTGISISMNVTPNDLEAHVVSWCIEKYLAHESIEPEDLQIEITESVAMSSVAEVQQDIKNLNQLGISVLMDDFGTGYSSIDRLSQLNFAALKLDKGVVQRMGTSTRNLDVVKSSISMARDLRMTSVAEGVEDEGAYNFLMAYGCEEVQGFWVSRPLEIEQFEAFLDDHPDFSGSQIGRVHQALYNIIHYRKSLIDAAFCCTLNADTVLQTVFDSEVALPADQSRFGLWYYGIGKRLEHTTGYTELEAPFLSFHECGQRFMRQLGSTRNSNAMLNTLIVEGDRYMDKIVVLLHQIERELLLGGHG